MDLPSASNAAAFAQWIKDVSQDIKMLTYTMLTRALQLLAFPLPRLLECTRSPSQNGPSRPRKVAPNQAADPYNDDEVEEAGGDGSEEDAQYDDKGFEVDAQPDDEVLTDEDAEPGEGLPYAWTD
eukprot:gene30391-biopygen16261